MLDTCVMGQETFGRVLNWKVLLLAQVVKDIPSDVADLTES